MVTAIVIDGYNLLHALGLVRKQAGPGELETARRRLIETLQRGRAPAAMTVVFDAKKKPRRAAGDTVVGAIQIVYAIKREADDVIEEMIAEHPQPARLQVVSDDRRIQQAAKRAGAIVLGCQAFLDQLEQPPPGTVQTAAPRAAAPLTPAELRHWLEEFADLEIPEELRDTFDDEGRR